MFDPLPRTVGHKPVGAAEKDEAHYRTCRRDRGVIPRDRSRRRVSLLGFPQRSPPDKRPLSGGERVRAFVVSSDGIGHGARSKEVESALLTDLLFRRGA